MRAECTPACITPIIHPCPVTHFHAFLPTIPCLPTATFLPCHAPAVQFTTTAYVTPSTTSNFTGGTAISNGWIVQFNKTNPTVFK